MLRIDSSKPCKVVYAICKHEYLGYLIEPHVVQLNANGDFSLTYQRLFSNTAEEFSSILNDLDFKLIKLLEETEQSHLIKRFHKKPIRPLEYFSTIFNETLYDIFRVKIDKRIVEALSLLQNKEIFLMGKEGWPAEKRLNIASEPASVLFHFRRNETETRYFPTIKYQGLRIEFMFKDAVLICNQPAWLLLEETLYSFKDDLEGKKLQPFLAKRYISIPKSSEKTYFEKFVAPLIEKHPVYAEGFEIRNERFEAIPVLKVLYVDGGLSQLQLYYRYGSFIFPAGSDRKVSVRTEKQGDKYIFHRVNRSLLWEKGKQLTLKNLGLNTDGSLLNTFKLNNLHPEEHQHDVFNIIDWLNEHHDKLEQDGFTFEQAEGGKRFVLGTSRIDLQIKEGNDWFDINAMVHFGPYQIPFIQLKNHIICKATPKIILP